ncbi:uncharacterized protein V1510DRAFT_397942 [Dipodascopsis tothii]|uniref:uncharacterized protein n=1 Tax=Dipodascopsis tothii TaxID=44089 RepID=UPI0034D0201D
MRLGGGAVRAFSATSSRAVLENLDPRAGADDDDKPRRSYSEIGLKMLETALVTFASIAVLGLTGYVYHNYYQHHVLTKMAAAFRSGTPALDLAIWHKAGEGDDTWIKREEQAFIDRVVAGEIIGRYYLIIGEKGTGKSSMLLDALRKVEGRNCSMFEAHADPEIVRIRLGKAMNYFFHEDYIGGLFSIRGPRDTTALLDIERAFDKLEVLALENIKKTGKPLILIVNSTHLMRDDEDGQDLVELFQQRAEAFSASGLVTMIFNSDDYWVYERFKRLGTRLDVITIQDLDRHKAVAALRIWRRKYHGEELTDRQCNDVYNMIGGRAQHLNRAAQHHDMLRFCRLTIEREKTWFLNQCGMLGMEMDDDVMESGKFSTSAMLLMRELVELDKAHRDKHGDIDDSKDHYLPSLPLWRARQVMTRPDYIQKYDNLNLFTIDSNSMVRADSVVSMVAFRQIAAMPGFDKLLEDTMERVAQIESLGRTREIVAKDLVNTPGSYEILLKQGPSRDAVRFRYVPPPDEEDEDAVPATAPPETPLVNEDIIEILDAQPGGLAAAAAEMIAAAQPAAAAAAAPTAAPTAAAAAAPTAAPPTASAAVPPAPPTAPSTPPTAQDTAVGRFIASLVKSD